MSILVVHRCAAPTTDQVQSVLLSALGKRTQYLEALDSWGVERDDWRAVTECHAQTWDALLRSALQSASGLQRLRKALLHLAEGSREVAMWYAGFPDEVPVVNTPLEFANLIVAQVLDGDLEPAARMTRP